MTTARPRLTRESALAALAQAGFTDARIITNTGVSASTRTVMVAIGGAESDLYIDAQNTANSNGSVDNGWLQINSAAWPNFDPKLLLSDAVYTAKAGYQVFSTQGLRAWYAYQLKDGTVGPYARRMPPGLGGPDVGVGTKAAVEVVKSVQAFLNRATPAANPQLVVDGAFGPKSEAALLAWKKINHNNGTKVVDATTWTKMGLL